MVDVAESRPMECEEFGLASLSFASGCTDVLSFLKLGEIFTSAMTGNTALLAIALGRGRMLVASRSFSALFGFMLGVAAASFIHAAAGGEKTARRLRQLLLLEAVILGCCATLWSVSGDPVRGGALYAIILLSAIGMGIQATVASRLNVSGISTIVFTSVLVRIVMALTGRLARPGAGAKPETAGFRAQVLTFAAYGCGAGLAGILVAHYFREVIWVPTAAVLSALGWSELASKGRPCD